MAKVIPRKARTDYPSIGVKKGDTYYTWQFRNMRGIQRSKNYPTRAQLTTSEFLTAVYDAVDVTLEQADEPDAIEALKTEIEEASSLANESFESMTPGLQAGENGQRMEQRASDADDFANAIDSAHTEYQEAYNKIDETRTAWEEYHDEMAAWDAATDEEQEEMTEPVEPDEQEGDWDELFKEALEACKEEIRSAEPDWE